MNWAIEPFSASHHRDGFDCGKQPFTDFLKQFAGQYEKRNLARTFVAVRQYEKKILGYYSLASGAVRFESMPETAAKKLPRHPVPVAVLARLAVDLTEKGQGLGRLLIGDALTRCVSLSDQLGIHAVFVEAIDDEAVRF